MVARAVPAQAAVTRHVEPCGHVGLLSRLQANAKDFYRQRRAGPPGHQLRLCPDALAHGERAAAPPDPRKRRPARPPGPGSAGRRRQARLAAARRRSPARYAPQWHRVRPAVPVARQGGQAVPPPPRWQTCDHAPSECSCVNRPRTWLRFEGSWPRQLQIGTRTPFAGITCMETFGTARIQTD